MTVRVRSAEGGELAFPSLEAVRQAVALGLVAPQDEVLEAGETTWRRADSLGEATSGSAPRGPRDVRWPLALAGAALLALLLLGSARWEARAAGAALAFALGSVMLTLTARALRRRR
jgi:hypothetical protein